MKKTSKKRNSDFFQKEKKITLKNKNYFIEAAFVKASLMFPTK
jgi:hypothetical protein